MNIVFPMPALPNTVGTATQIGAGTFQVFRTYAGSCSVSDLLRQRILRAAGTASSIDGGIGTAV